MEQINGIDIRQLADQYGTPLYVYDKNKIIDNYNKLNNAFIKHYPNTHIHYSVKANSNLSIISLFNELGSGVDCSSPIEIYLAEKAGLPQKKTLYTGNYESPDDFRALRGKDIMLNLDDINSFHRLIKIFTPKQIAFRINPGIGRGGYEGITTAGTDAKFGVPYERAYDAYNLAKQLGVNEFGIHMMTGSNNLEPYYFAEVVEKLMKIAGHIFGKLGIQPQYIDIGGGMGIPYEQDEEELNVELMAEMVTEIFKEKCKKYDFGEPKLLLEPGRFLVANAGYLIANVTGIKNSYKTFIGVDAGMSTLLRPALYGANHRVFVYGKDELEQNVNLCGQICENSDIFAKNVFMPVVEENDLLIFGDVGAYGYVMASNYNNRLRPAEVMIDDGVTKLIRRREKLDDLMALYE